MNGIQCVSPFDTGDSPDCGTDPVGTKKPNRKSPITYAIGGVTVNAGDFIPYDNLGSPINGQTGVACESPDDSAPDYCSPWADSYGFFFGDGSTHNVVLTLTELDTEKVSTGNFLKGVSVFEHTYSNGKKDANNPYVAFFTGGDRLSKGDGKLQNNFNGRFRLEATVNIQGTNRSPVAASMPILPVPYTGRSALSAYGYMATFQVAAYDPDTTIGVGNDPVKFYLADYMKQGALLSNAIPEGGGTANWYKEEYEAKRLSILSSLCNNDCANCPKGGGKLFEGKEFNCVDYPPWSNDVHLAHSPKYLTIEEDTGIVRWETGINPFDTDTALYKETRVGYGVTGECPDKTSSTPCTGRDPLPLGFYNLVLDIRSSSKDPCLTGSTCTESDILGHISVPLDFMMYLYPPMAMCSGDCANTQAGITTFRDTGLYGHSKSFGDGNYAHNGPGTGDCTICGGGESQNLLFNHTKCQSTSEGCLSAGCPGYGVDVDGNPAGALAVDSSCTSVTASGKPVVSILPAVSACKYNTAPVWVDEAECGTNGLDGKTPCNSNPNSNAVVVAKKGQEVSFNLVAQDMDDCTELSISASSLYTGESFTVPGTSTAACTSTEAKSASTCPYNMVLGDHERIGTDGKSVRRQFKWGLKNTDTQSTDPRPDKLSVCFYAYDNYVQSKFRCIDLMLTTDEAVYWRDDRTSLTAMDNFAGPTPANGTTFYATPGQKVEFALDAKQAGGFGPIDLYLSQGSLPEGATLTDDTTINSDPYRKTFSWTPKSGQECTYELCFMAKNSKTAVDYAMTLDTPATIDERCYKIVVTDTVLSFSGGTFVNAPSVVSSLDTDCGVTMGLWFFPKDGVDASMPLITAGYSMGGIKHVVHQLNWVKFTPEVYNDGDTLQDAGSYYSLQYVDDVQGIDLSSEPIFCSDSWHHAAFTISKDGIVSVYLDGAETIQFSTSSRNYHRDTTLTFDTKSTGKALSVGTVVASKAGSTGFLYMGSFDTSNTFNGYMNEVFIYSRGLAAKELKSLMFSPLDTSSEKDLVAYYKFDDYQAYKHSKKDALSVLNNLDFDAKGLNIKDEIGSHSVTACLTDCATGSLQFAYLPSPTIAACPYRPTPGVIHASGGTEITIDGDNFAQSQFLKCHIGDDVVKATFVSEEQLKCTAPGSGKASASLVKISNGGSVKSLYVPVYQMEIALSLTTPTDKVTAPNVGSQLASGGTVGMWVHPETVTFSSEPVLFSLGSGLNVKISSSGNIILVDKVGATAISSSASAKLGSWVYVALTTSSDGKVTLIVDGVSVGSTSGEPVEATADLVLGGGGTMTCLYDEVAVWSKVLTECEISFHMWGKFSNGPFCPVGAGVEAEPNADKAVFYQFDDEAGVSNAITSVSDSTGSITGTVAGTPTLKYTTVPFLAPSFSALKPIASTCPKTTIGYDTNAKTQFQSKNLGFGPNSAFSYPVPHPNTCGEYYDHLRDQNIPFDGYDDVTVYGFGFAPSSFLKCDVGGVVVEADYKNYDEIACKSTSFDIPGEHKISVANDGMESSCGYGKNFLLAPQTLKAKEMAMSFSGSKDYVYIDNISSGLNNTGLTFGAWFYPKSVSVDYEGVLACFASACNATTSATSQICAMYQKDQVYLQSDLPDTPYGDLDFSNVTVVGTTVSVEEWHYFEVSVEPREMISDIASDLVYPDTGLPKGVTMKASLSVDGKKLAGDIRVPGLPVSGGRFFVGGMECEGSSVTLDRSFNGLIDEVRIYDKPNYVSDWSSSLSGKALEDVFAYYKFNAKTGESSGKYTVEPTVSSIPESSKGNSVKAAQVKGAKTALIEAPWEPLTLKGLDIKESALISNGQVATLSGFNVAKTQSLACVFTLPSTNGTVSVTSKATYISGTSLSCPIPSTDLPGPVTVQAGNPKASSSAVINYKESVLDFEGDVVKNSKVVGGTANDGSTLTMTCPTGLRMDKVNFASFGRPTVGNDKTITNCDGTTTYDGFDFSTYEVDSCHSDNGQVPHFTTDVVEKYCLGQTSCSVPAQSSIFGDPCPSKEKWLSVAIRCSDRYITKDYVEANDVALKLTGSEYSFGAWVYPRSKSGIQAILSFGSKVPSTIINSALLQFKSDGSKGVFFYYDDCIYDVAMKDATGQDLEVEVNNWYHVMVTVSSTNEASLYLNGAKTATFSTSCRPKSDGTGSFIMGMDMDDLMYPKEYFDGLMDEVRVYDRALTDSDVLGLQDFATYNTIGNLVSYFNFNNGTGNFATDVIGDVKGTFSASSETTYSTSAQAFVGSSNIHTTYSFAGVPWLPASLSDISSSTGPLKGGTTVTIEGVNLAESHSVHLDGSPLATTKYISDTQIEVTIPSTCESGTSCSANSVQQSITIKNTKDKSAGLDDSVSFKQDVGVADIQNGLTCWFPFIDSMKDLSGNGNDASFVGNVTKSKSRTGMDKAAYSLLEDSFIDLQSCSSSGKFVAMWVLFGEEPFPTTCSGQQDYEETIGYPTCSAESGKAHSQIVPNAWKFVAGTTSRTYVNGVPVSGPTAYSSIISDFFSTGKIKGGNGAQVDDVWVYDRELYDEEVKLLYETDGYALSLGDSSSVEISALGVGVTPLGAPGLLAQVYGGGKDYNYIASKIDLSWGSTNFNSEVWSFNASGYIYAPVESLYTFFVTGDDGIQVSIAQSKVIDKSSYSGVSRTVSGTMDLKAGWHSIEILYTDKGGDAAISLEYESQDGAVPRQVVPSENLRAGTGPLTVAMWIKPDNVSGLKSIVSQSSGGMSAFDFSVSDGGLSASLNVVEASPDCGAPFEVYREFKSWKSAIEVDVWQHVAFSYDGTTISFFVNGILTDQKAWSKEAMIVPSESDVVIGGGYSGLVYDFALYSKAISSTSAMKPVTECLSKTGTDVSVYLPLNEGIGMYSENIGSGAYKPGNLVKPVWVPSVCSTYGASASTTKVVGTALENMLAGQCGLVTISAHDKCGTKLKSGGDNFTVEIVGPLHIHTEMTTLSVGSGITDLEDGSYLVNMKLETAGYYKIFVKLGGTNIAPSGYKVYVHPFVTDATKSYIFDDVDPLGIKETETSFAGVPVTYTLQTVDTFGNLRTVGCDLDQPQVSFNGPVPFLGSVSDNSDGTYSVTYNAQVSGKYRMAVTASNASVCSYGGYTCKGGAQSSSEYCTLGKPATGGDCNFCVDVKEGSSLSLSGSSTHATFPDSDELDLVNSFTISAFVKKTGVSGYAKEYIVSKQSEHSGKGYWFALVSLGGEMYTLEAGVYVGSETFRIAKADVSIPTTSWTHLSVSYDGTKFVLLMNDALLSTTSFDDDEPKYQKRSSQAVHVGKYFKGLIDNVMIYSDVILSPQATALCPQNVKFIDDKLVAYYRFNEGFSHVTKDSSKYSNDGIVGLVCDKAMENKAISLKCPSGYKITEILYANFGENVGGCGNYQADCTSSSSNQIVEAACLNKETCSVTASTANFGNVCPGSARSLAVNAVCSASTSGWSTDTAPTNVGKFKLDPPECPYSGSIQSKLPASMSLSGDCSKWSMSSAIAGEITTFAATVSDQCGYPGYAPPSVLDLSAEITFPGYLDTSIAPECGHIATTTPAPLSVNSTYSGDGQPCGRFGDVYLFSYLPQNSGVGHLKITSKGSPITLANITVVPGTISPDHTEASGHLVGAEAGVATTIVLTPKDAVGNGMKGSTDHSSTFQYSITDSTGKASAAKVYVEKELNGGIHQTYKFTITYPSAGQYELALYVNEKVIKGFPKTIAVTKPLARKAITYDSKPVTRFEHTMESYKTDLYIFGGATHQGTYSGETWKWTSPNVDDDWKYMRMIEVSNMAGSYIVEFEMDTQEMIDNGKLKSDCSDIIFHTASGHVLDYFMAPRGVVSGCGNKKTTLYVSLTASMDKFYMLYGSHKMSTSPTSSIFEYFEDFEGDDLPGNFTLETDACTPVGDISAFTTSDDVAVTGKKSLKVEAESTVGGSIKTILSNMGKFRLKFYFFDTLCDGIHFLSPDFQACTSLGQIDANTKIESNSGSAVGVYSSSTQDKYAYASPWKAGSAARTFGFKEFSLVDDDKTLHVYIDQVLSVVAPETELDKIFIRGTAPANKAKGSVGYFDTIMATSYDPDVSIKIHPEEGVSYSPGSGWTQVGLTNPPPKRQAHSSAVYSDSMYIFGGERSSYFYGDLWQYEFATDTWSFIPVKNASSLLGRYDHSAVVYGDAMYIYGGRSPSPLGDFWKYDFKLQTWNAMPTSSGMAPRFGHVAVVEGDEMFVHGGYVHDQSQLTTELWSFDFKSSTWTLVGPRKTNYAESYVSNPDDAISFPGLLAPARYSGIGINFMSKFYVLGGAGGQDMMTELDDVWAFSSKNTSWTQLDGTLGLERYDAAGAGVGSYLAIFGGHGKGKFFNDLYYFFVAED